MRSSRPAAIPPTPATLQSEPDFETFYIAHRDAVLRFACQQAGPGIDAENVAAESWKRAYVNWRWIKAPHPWIYRVVINLTSSAAREASRTYPDDALETSLAARVTWASVSTAPDAAWAERITDISRGLRQLPARQRAAVLLSYHGWTSGEIADVLQCTPATVRVHLHLGRARLRKYLSEPTVAAGRAASSGLEGRIA